MTRPGSPWPERRLLFVHAHPDDESIANGATMSAHADAGDHVTLVTCTLGEEGEVIPPELAHLAADRDDTLGAHRAAELAAAMRELGVSDHRMLGGAGRYRDSGMTGSAAGRRTNSFWRADVDEAAAHLVAIVREVRPQIVVTYDPTGGYGHPDHIQAHRVTMRAHVLAADPGFRPDLGQPWEIAEVYWNCVPRPVVAASLSMLHGAPERTCFGAVADLADVSGVVEEDQVAVAFPGGSHLDRKIDAMRAHATQITVSGRFFALSNQLGQPVLDHEYYRRADPSPPGTPPVHNLFSGLGHTG
ncbi:N-acetyl-1-D-myo-inositol-2-amino-2-deoxy-alpha-D-glucopyranoside deacetylase [Streptomyces sp. NBC_01298]|uniref:N-acetyl-1-D-myo-inositol-2-amino-2-deoxy-alpha- D-glucopyranoside deacetylase n=1 Tax=Streptomyces sp. NBC_01298 TaxID=2903817 RepID=UPI002E158865|nr:N-acetyl-1-D-myo-inositol-2-amino-2-deoxy-alpha-D-glucopyranoside deacetylase [Streptomyces sp. NBC_01298]